MEQALRAVSKENAAKLKAVNMSWHIYIPALMRLMTTMALAGCWPARRSSSVIVAYMAILTEIAARYGSAVARKYDIHFREMMSKQGTG